MRFYQAMLRLGRPRSFVGKILLVSFLGVHVPLIGLIVYLLSASSLPPRESLTVGGVVLVATLLGTAATMAALWALVAPIRLSSAALHAYLNERRIPQLPARPGDEVGQLMADIQEAVTRLDAALDAALSARDQALTERRATFSMLAGMGHELRTPLNAVLGFSELLQHELRGPLPGDAASYASDIHRSGARLLDLVQSLLDLGHAEAGGHELSEERVDLSRAVGTAVALCRHSAGRRKIALQVTLPERPIVLTADPRSLKQLLLHLVIGLVEAVPAGSVLHVTLGTGAGTAVFNVRASGGGFLADDLPDALAPCVEGELPVGTVASTSALGLRLMVARALAATLDATLSLRSAPDTRGAGLVFRQDRRTGKETPTAAATA